MSPAARNTAMEVGLTPAWTTVLWTVCLAVGIAGLLAPRKHPAAPAHQHTPVTATVIHVDLTRHASLPPNSAAPSAEQLPPAPPTIAPPAPAAVVAPEGTPVAFALPTTGPARTATAAQAVPRRSNAATDVEHLTYGVGEGDQPAPEYPLEADLAGQHGSIVVRFTVGEDGRVTSAEIIEPCPFPLLNQSALRTIREEWRFKPGPVRVDDITIQFKRKHE